MSRGAFQRQLNTAIKTSSSALLFGTSSSTMETRNLILLKFLLLFDLAAVVSWCFKPRRGDVLMTVKRNAWLSAFR